MTDLAASVLEGNRLALARALSQVENGTAEGRVLLAALFPHTGRAHLVGVTGAPGTGKSTLVNQLALFYRNPPDGAQACRVAVIAVDPSSPFTGGALLGDRIRMQDLATDSGVFIRSMSSRGSSGGVARATADAVRVLDALGMDMVIVETVGAGQSEVAVMDVVQTVVVVVVPGLGDDIQAIKAGILEIGDIFVINKADRDGVEATQRELEMMLEFDDDCRKGWRPQIVRTVASKSEGIEELIGKIEGHREMMKREGLLEESERRRCRREVLELLKHKAVLSLLAEYGPDDFDALVKAVAERKIHPHDAVERIMEKKKG